MKRVQILFSIILAMCISSPAIARKNIDMRQFQTRSASPSVTDCLVEVFLENDNTLTVTFNQHLEDVTVYIQSDQGNIVEHTGLNVSAYEVLTFNLPGSPTEGYQLLIKFNGSLMIGTFTVYDKSNTFYYQ